MRAEAPTHPLNTDAEVAELVETLLRTAQRLEELTGGEVDTVAGRDGKIFLLQRAQEQLRINEADRETSILNALSAQIALLDTRGLIVSTNDAWRKSGGRHGMQGSGSRPGLNYLSICDSLSICDNPGGEDAAEARQLAEGIRRVLSGAQKTFSIEYPCPSPAGQLWFHVTVTPLGGERPNGAVVTQLDVTGQKRAKDDLRESERRFRDMLGNVDLLSLMLSREGRITYCNDYLLRLTGWRREEVIGRDWFALFIPPGAGDMREVLSGMLADVQAAAHHESEILMRCGGELLIRWNNTVLRSAAGDVIGTASIGEDITARRAINRHIAQMEGRYRGLLEAAPDAMVVVNQSGEIVLLNVQAEKQFGYLRNELVGQQVRNIIPEGFAERLIADSTRSAADALAQQMGTGIELLGRRKDGSEFPIEIMLSPLESADGILVTAAIRNISVRKDAETHLVQMEGRYRGLLEAAPDAMVVVNQSGEIVLLNVQAEKQFGYRRDELIGQKVKNMIPEGFAERLLADGLRSAEDALAQQIGTGIELIGRRKNGSDFPIEIMLSPLASPEGMLVTVAIRDISLRKNADAQMAHTAQHDFLTGLPNRVLLNDRINQAVTLAPRHRKQVAVLFLDLDGFKHINDSLGHSVGDKLLQSIAKRLEECVRSSDTVSRQGGDEFVVLLSEAEQWEEAATVAGRMLDSVAEAHFIDQHELHVTTSIGVSVFPDDGSDAETLIKSADTAMYHAKENGRQSYQFFKPEMNVRAVARQAIEEGLRRALEREELALYYQPKIDLRTGRITGGEALLRWKHPIRGLISPAQFIPIAEECGLILPIGHWVLREACRQARAWLDAGLAPVTIAVNVSGLQLRQARFPEDVFAILRETGLSPGSLELELTESVLMKHAEYTASVLQSLRETGVQVAVDDFGTGYSSLSYLTRFPIDALKIDQSFVRQIRITGEDASIIIAVISMARSLKLRVIAEGVETAEQLQFLQANQCDEAQGYYFSRPVPREDFARLLETGYDLAVSPVY